MTIPRRPLIYVLSESQSLSESSITESYDLFEMDWAYVSDYLDTKRKFPLHWLSSNSHGFALSLSCSIEWVLLLHHLDSDIRGIVIEMVQNGMIR